MKPQTIGSSFYMTTTGGQLAISWPQNTQHISHVKMNPQEIGCFAQYDHHRGSNGYIVTRKHPKYSHFVNNSSIWLFWFHKTATTSHLNEARLNIFKISYQTVEGIPVYDHPKTRNKGVLLITPKFTPLNDTKELYYGI